MSRLALDEDFNDHFFCDKYPKILEVPVWEGRGQITHCNRMFHCNSFFLFQWTQLKIRKQNLTRLFEKMQAYQYEQISADPDKPLADGIRALDTTDMER